MLNFYQVFSYKTEADDQILNIEVSNKIQDSVDSFIDDNEDFTSVFEAKLDLPIEYSSILVLN